MRMVNDAEEHVTPCVGVWIETQQVCPYKAGY